MSGWGQIGICLLLLAALAWSSALAVRKLHDQRSLYGELQAVQSRHDALVTEQSRLLLERGAIASYQNIERVALEELNMRFPHSVEFIRR